MKLVVTGAGGLIGGGLCRWAESQGWQVHRLSVRGPLPAGDDPLAEELLAIGPDLVVHAAACHSPRHGPAAWPAQVAGTLGPAIRVACAVPPSVRLALFLGSCEEYGNTKPPFVETGPVRAVSPYGWAKIAAFEAVHLIAQRRGLPLCWARPFLTFGPGQAGELVVPSLIAACLGGEPLPLTGGEQTRDFIYVDDVVTMIAAILRRPEVAVGEVVNLGSGVPRTIRDVGEKIRRLAGGGTLLWGALPYRQDEPMEFYASTRHWRTLFGEQSPTPFDDALQATIDAAKACHHNGVVRSPHAGTSPSGGETCG